MKLNESRIEKINEADLNKANYVAYWMQSAQRMSYNHALSYAAQRANQLNQPLFVFFLIDKNYPEAEYGHYEFMFAGLKELKKELEQHNINFFIFSYEDVDIFKKITEKASLLITEKAYLKNLRKWKTKAADLIKVAFYTVETNLICPVEEVSEKEEYAAYTIRKKINKIKDQYLYDYNQVLPENTSGLKLSEELKEYLIKDLDQYLAEMDFAERISYKKFFKGGYQAAEKKLNDFLANKIASYGEKRNIPHLDYQSDLSPNLHFGQISAQEIAVKTLEKAEATEDFLEELIIRRELSFNFVYYNQQYDGSLKDILPDWAFETLKEHSSDTREYNYSYQQLKNADTHDKYWNAAQKEMKITAKMHNYMRMYWGKKILEWVSEPEKAYQYALKLNNKYSLDGRDPNSYAGVAWCFGKHDRAWQERDIFGKVRYMNANGLERKFDMEKYLAKIEQLEAEL